LHDIKFVWWSRDFNRVFSLWNFPSDWRESWWTWIWRWFIFSQYNTNTDYYSVAFISDAVPDELQFLLSNYWNAIYSALLKTQRTTETKKVWHGVFNLIAWCVNVLYSPLV